MSEDKPVHIERRSSYPETLTPVYRDLPVDVENEDSFDFQVVLNYWRIIVLRRWTIAAVVVACVVVATIWNFRQTPLYRATASVQVAGPTENVLTFQDVVAATPVQTQIEVLQSKALARAVVDDLRLAGNAEFKGGAPSLWRSSVSRVAQTLKDLFNSNRGAAAADIAKPARESDPLRGTVNAYLARLSVTPPGRNSGSNLVQVSFQATDPRLATRIVNAHAEHFVDENLRYKLEAAQRASNFLVTQIGAVKASLEKSERALQEFANANQIFYTEEGKSNAKLETIQSELIKAQVDRIQKQAYDPFAEKGDLDALPQIHNNSAIAGLNNQIQNLERQDAELALTYGPDHPKRVTLRTSMEETQRLIAEEKKRVLDNIQAERSAAIERERLLKEEYDRQVELTEGINRASIQYGILKREVDSNQQLFDTLTVRLKQAEVAAPLLAADARVLDLAEVPGSPFWPNKTRNILFSGLFGLGIGIGLVFFREYVDDTFKAPDDVTRYLQVPALGVIPQLGSLEGRRGYGYGYGYGYLRRAKPQADTALAPQRGIDLVTHYSPSSVVSEAYRSVRTSLMLSSPDRAPKTILVTSAQPSEGKSATAANIAVSLTQMGSRVVIVDADMRKPRVHSIFSVKNDKGLANFLTGGCSLRDILQESAVPNLFVIPCGLTPPNPAELILSNRFQKLIDVLSQYFDYILIDSPPVNNVSDARVLATICDGTVVVAKASSTSRRAVRHAVDHLMEAHARISGIVLNDLDVRKRAYYGYSGGYYKGYGYGAYGTYGKTPEPQPEDESV